jgi:hypothetical protein
MADRQAIICPMATANTPEIMSAATALAADPVRGAWMIQNLGQNALYVRLGAGATTSVFHVVLKAGTANDDGTGGTFAQENGIIWTGIVSIAGTSPRYTVTNLTA